jgi:hypothetical protein
VLLHELGHSVLGATLDPARFAKEGDDVALDDTQAHIVAVNGDLATRLQTVMTVSDSDQVTNNDTEWYASTPMPVEG